MRLDEYELGSVPSFDAFSGYSLAHFTGIFAESCNLKKCGSFSLLASSNVDNWKQTQGPEALCRPHLTLSLLPFVRHFQQLRHLRRRLVVCREHVIHVLLEAVVVELSPLFDFARHLLIDFFDV